MSEKCQYHFPPSKDCPLCNPAVYDKKPSELASSAGSVAWTAIGFKRDLSGISTLNVEYKRPMTLAEVIADIERRHPDLRSISAQPQNEKGQL